MRGGDGESSSPPAERLSEELSVHVRKARQILIERLLTPVRRRVENLPGRVA